METPTPDPMETVTGLGATGAEIILAFVKRPVLSAHPLVPILQIGFGQKPGDSDGDFDLVLGPDTAPAEQVRQILELALDTLRGLYTPNAVRRGDVNFQVTRGLLGVSM